MRQQSHGFPERDAMHERPEQNVGGERGPDLGADRTQEIPVIGRRPAAGSGVPGAVASPPRDDARPGVRSPRPPHLRERAARVAPGWLAVASAVLATLGCLWLGVLSSEWYVPGLNSRTGAASSSAATSALRAGASLCLAFACFATLGLTWGGDGTATVLRRRRGYRGTYRGTGLVWVPPWLRRRRVDVRLRHWRTEGIRAVDGDGIELSAAILVVWQVRDTARAVFGVADHETYLTAVVEAAVVKVLATMPCHAFGAGEPSLRDSEWLSARLTTAVAADCRAVGLDVYSVQPSRIDYAPDMAAAMRRQQIFSLDARLREAVADNLVDTVHDTVERLADRNMVHLDDRQRGKLVCDLAVAFYAARGSAPLLAKEPPSPP
ncbi:SPFH domain-containing protein [Streptomyces sp. NPDC050485]|uniref:SPFH domain-containing protein n=1 Tax=Streptomyces sp. NPDC050485 TaxID=3365617 RepID=UPI00378AE1C5